MAGVNTAGTYKLEDAVLTMDTGGTPVTLEIAATKMAIVAEQHFASHARTGGVAPFEEYIDSTFTLMLGYLTGYGTDGIEAAFAALEGDEVAWSLETSGASSPSATFPTFTFTAKVPRLSPLPETAWGEFAGEDTISIPIKGTVTKVTA